MDEEDRATGKPSLIKPPMIKPPMIKPPMGAPPLGMSPQRAHPSAPFQAPSSAHGKSANKLIVVINIILAVALIVGLAILAYRWLK